MRERLPLALRFYRLASKIAAPPVASRLLAWRLKRGKENPERIGERYGVAGAPRPPGPVIWLHGASVGEVLAVMRGLAASQTTMIVVTHEIGFARDVADRVVFMDGGKIVEMGPPEQVIDHPSSARLRQFLHRFSSPESRS